MTELLNTLYVQTQGASLHLDHDAVRIVSPETPGRRTLPLQRLEAIVVYGHVTVSGELLARCAEDSRPVTWMSLSGRFLARGEGPVRGNVLLRHAQHLSCANPAQRLAIARCCVAGKIQNCRQILLRGARDTQGQRKETLRELAAGHATVLEPAREAVTIDQLLGIEGNAARLYFRGLGLLVRSDLDTGGLTGRTRRPATDPPNALLSFMYGLLRSLVHGATEQAGLDPYIGFLHGIRPAKPALALDLMEEFRPVLADRLAITLLNRQQVRASHFTELPGGAVRLTDEGRRLVLTEWQRSKQREWPHQLLGRKVAAQLLPAVQSRILSRHIRGELPSYVPWIAS
jgi:CRISPR-associated protein Cas1